MPPSLEMDFEMMVDVVSGATWVHLGAGVLVLAGTGIGDREHLAAGLGAHQVDRRVLHGQP